MHARPFPGMVVMMKGGVRRLRGNADAWIRRDTERPSQRPETKRREMWCPLAARGTPAQKGGVSRANHAPGGAAAPGRQIDPLSAQRPESSWDFPDRITSMPWIKLCMPP